MELPAETLTSFHQREKQLSLSSNSMLCLTLPEEDWVTANPLMQWYYRFLTSPSFGLEQTTLSGPVTNLVLSEKKQLPT